MVRQRRDFLALAVFLACLRASSLSAQQVFIDSMWVSHPSVCAGPDPSSDRYLCAGPPGANCPGDASSCPLGACRNISNDPHIEFENGFDPTVTPNKIYPGFPPPQCPQAILPPIPNLPPGDSNFNICNTQVFVCCKVGWNNEQSGNANFGIDFIELEMFKFGQGSNPLDPQSTPPVRTFFIDNPGQVFAGSDSDECLQKNNSNPFCSEAACNGHQIFNAPPGTLAGPTGFCRLNEQAPGIPPGCVPWDGSFNIQGEFGKSNGQYGFRCTVATNQTSSVAGNINITQVRAYPSGPTLNFQGCSSPGVGTTVDQAPITVDVMNVHVVRTSPTVVGQITGVGAEPYNITYRLSKDATTFIDIFNSDASPNVIGTSGFGLAGFVRSVVPGQPRVGEGIPNGNLQNGDAWNGRFENGDLGTPGVYLGRIEAFAADQFGYDIATPFIRQIGLDTLQITDIQVQPLTDQSTSLAIITYVLTEAATAFIDIYPPGTQFLNGLNDVNSTVPDQDPRANNGSPKNFAPFLNSGPAPLVRHIEEHKDFRKSVFNIWDGRDLSGAIVPDGDYVFVLYAAMPSQNGIPFKGIIPAGDLNDKRIWSTNAKSGFVTVTRGFVTISQVTPASTVIGASSPVAGLDPFTFTYSLSRDANVSLKILDSSGIRTVRTLVNNEERPGNFLNRERWIMPVDDHGLFIASGTYLAQLTAADPYFPSKVSTVTASFPIDLFRITDVFTTPLLTGATDVVTLSYLLSRDMQVAWNIYPPGTVISQSTASWPPCGTLQPSLCPTVTGPTGSPAAPIITIQGMRPGRLRVTEFWDGRNTNGLFVPDGTYIFTLAAQSTTTPQYFASDQIFGTLTVARGSVVFPVFNVLPTVPQLFNSSQTITLPPFEVDYSLTRQSSVTVQILTTDLSPKIIRHLIPGIGVQSTVAIRDANIINREFWDARDDVGNFVPPGLYTIQVVARDLASLSSPLTTNATAQQTIAVDPLRIYDVAISPLRGDVKDALIAYQVSETMRVSIKIFKPGTSFDINGNAQPPDAVSLVKRIVGVRPARTEITESWDGTDLKLSRVLDGNYIFRLIGSTDITSIDTVSGNAAPGTSLADDLVIAEVPVSRGGSLNPAADFETNSFVYPNPLRGPSATWQIYVPFQAEVGMKIYNIAGELVFDQGFGQQAADSYVNFTWNKTNQAGRSLAQGVYFALIREDTVLGDKNVFQTVKKFLIP